MDVCMDECMYVPECACLSDKKNIFKCERDCKLGGNEFEISVW